MPPKPEDITLFYWGFSPWAGKVTAYLALRGLPHTECDQPITLPRPDMKALGVNYRRIPIVALGRDVFCDTLCILDTLETLFPSNDLRATNPTDRALEKLLEKWTDVVVFKPAVEAVPSTLPLGRDPAFIKNRTELWGRDWAPSEQDKLRPAGLSNLQANFGFLEELLGDGREWVLGTEGLMLADIHAAWIFGWMRNLPDGLPEEYFGKKLYPKTGAWLDRYEEAVQSAKEKAKSSTVILSSEQALSRIFASGSFIDQDGEVQDDPIGVKRGQRVKVAPIDTGFNHIDVGRLISLNTKEVVIEKASERDGKPVRLHFPRWNFSVVAATGTADSG